MRWLKLSVVAVFALLWGSPVVFAADFGSKSQLHIRTGQVSGSFSGATSGSLISSTGLDLEYEVFQNRHRALLFRSAAFFDLKQNRAIYTYAGMGSNYYFLSTGPLVDTTDGATQFTVTPKYRYYWGWDLGLSQSEVVPKVIGATYTTNIDGGLHLGAIYQATRAIGVEAQLGYSRGYGFTTVSAATSVLKMLFGVSVYF